MKRHMFFLVIHGLFWFLLAQPPLVWTRVYDRSTADYAFGVSTDDANNIVVAGSSYNGVDYDFCTVKYTPAGDTIWTRIYDAGGSDIARGVIVDGNNDIVVTGASRLDTIYDYLTVKYDAAGNLLWQTRYETGLDKFATSAVADSARNVIVTGYAFNGFDYDYLTVKYNAGGDTIWSRRFDAGFNDLANDLTADPMGNIIVTGSSVDTSINRHTYLTVKYSPDGETLWTRRYQHETWHSFAYAVAADAECNIIVTGNPWYPAKFITLKYDSLGDMLWLRQHVPGYITEYYARDVAVDQQNDIIVTCEYYYGASFDYYTFKYTSAGDSVWTSIYGSGSGIDEYAQGVACDAVGGIVVTGYVFNNGNIDYLTVKYDEQGAVAEQMLLPVRTNEIELHAPWPNPFRHTTTIRYSLPVSLASLGEAGDAGCAESEIRMSNLEMRTPALNIYDAAGRLVKSFNHGAVVVWDGIDDSGRNLPGGVYFVRLETPQGCLTRKIIKLR